MSWPTTLVRAQTRVAELEQERDALQARCDALSTALEPFAKIADDFQRAEERDALTYPDDEITAIDLGHCRAARAALAEAKQ